MTGWPLEIRHKRTGMHMSFIPAGEFMMGSPKDEKDRQNDETQHRVKLTKPFYLGKYEVTQAEWKKVMGKEPWKGERYTKENPRHAATYISWEDCREFLKKLNVARTTSFALPTEAQWEYACRSATTTRFYYGEDETSRLLKGYAWFDDNAWDVGDKYAHPVGQKKPSAWGLYDMHGNVWEWCQDWYGNYPNEAATNPVGPTSGSYRVQRGGSWYGSARYCRAADRFRFLPGFRVRYLGFRLALSPVQ
jgi:formylglycine-generating enzyme required for sulfatase activity